MQGNNIASEIGVRLEGKCVSKIVITVSRGNLSASEISMLSKGLKFLRTANKIDRAKLQRELAKDVIIERYHSCLEERLLDIEIPCKIFNKLTKEEREGLYSLKDDHYH